jgi:hypothetical protein
MYTCMYIYHNIETNICNAKHLLFSVYFYYVSIFCFTLVCDVIHQTVYIFFVHHIVFRQFNVFPHILVNNRTETSLYRRNSFGPRPNGELCTVFIHSTHLAVITFRMGCTMQRRNVILFHIGGGGIPSA